MNGSSSDVRPLPILVGITGHRDILPEVVTELENRVELYLLRLQKQYPHCPVLFFSSLAEGADRIGARAALKTGCSLRVPLPMERKEYEKDFDPISRLEFDEFLSRADCVFVVETIEPVPENPTRGYYFRQAGLYIAKRVHILLTLWDGAEILYPEGGGTFETVDFMRRENGIICHFATPRLSNPDVILSEEKAGMQEDKRLAIIETFNRELENQKELFDEAISKSRSHVIDSETDKNLNAGLSRLLNTFLHADALSIKNRNLKLLTLRLLSTFGLLMVLAFLLYDEIESDLMLTVYGVLILCALVIYVISNRRRFHEKYISYRALAEALRIQFYWTLCEISEDICDHYTYTQKTELDFVRFVMRSIEAEHDDQDDTKSQTSPDCVHQFWIAGQHAYHSATALRKGKHDSRNTFAAKSMFATSILLFFAVLIMELFFKEKCQETVPIHNILQNFLLIHNGQAVTWRSILKIILGVISAGTAFFANYYGSLSLPQEIFNTERMRVLFESALCIDLKDKALFDETMYMIGRESLIESAAWYVMQRENVLKLFI